MSTLERARAQLRSGAASLLPDPRSGGYGMFRGGDRRRRPVLLLSASEGERLLQELQAESAEPGSPLRRPPPQGARLAREEEAALERLAADWEASSSGLYRSIDWSAPASSGQPRGPGRAQAPGAAARARVRRALAGLAPILADIVMAHVTGRPLVGVLERQGWPARHARSMLRLAAAQLAHAYRAEGAPEEAA
jgi:hypothetical protein